MKRIITGDEQRIIYNNVVRKKINSDVYCRQLNKLNAAVEEKRPELVNRNGIIFHHDNATPQTSLTTRKK